MQITSALIDRLRQDYAPRHISFNGIGTYGDAIWKEYEISLDGSPIPAEDWQIARELTQGFIGEPSPFDRVGIGVTIVHAGADGTYILVLEWIEGFMSLQRIYMRNQSTEGAFEPAPNGLHPCIWERAIYAHENEAYRRLLASKNVPIDVALEEWKESTFTGTW